MKTLFKLSLSFLVFLALSSCAMSRHEYYVDNLPHQLHINDYVQYRVDYGTCTQQPYLVPKISCKVVAPYHATVQYTDFTFIQDFSTFEPGAYSDKGALHFVEYGKPVTILIYGKMINYTSNSHVDLELYSGGAEDPTDHMTVTCHWVDPAHHC